MLIDTDREEDPEGRARRGQLFMEDPPSSDAADPPPGELYTIESESRLSRSMLWQAQRRYFHLRGIEAWRNATVPHYITNNPALAFAYAELIFGFLRDCTLASAPQRNHAADRQPLYIVELGAGSGRFAHLFLVAFRELQSRLPLRDARICYVMTDFTETNIDYWRSHPTLRAHVEQGLLDFAWFDTEGDEQELHLYGGATLKPGSLRHPLAVIANYVFDGVSQDAFSVRDGKLHEDLISLHTAEPELDPSEVEIFGRLSMTYHPRPTSTEYYPEPVWNELLREYERSLDGQAFLFPSGALRCIRRLQAIANGKLLMVVGDRGGHEATIAAPGDPGLAVHGSFSLPVNYHAIKEYAARSGGSTLADAPHNHLNVTAFLFGEPEAGYCETRLAYASAFERAGPDDFYSLRRGLESLYERFALDQLIAVVRGSHFDPRILSDCLPAILQQVDGATPPLRQQLARLVQRTWANYYHFGEPLDLPFGLAVLLYRIAEYAAALTLFEQSRALYGDDSGTRWNVGLCHLGLRQAEAAVACFQEAVRLDPAFHPVGALQPKFESLHQTPPASPR